LLSYHNKCRKGNIPLSEYAFGGIMSLWNVKQTAEFQDWFDEADESLQEDIVEHIKLLEQFGPNL
jgi:hypothetical protein